VAAVGRTACPAFDGGWSGAGHAALGAPLRRVPSAIVPLDGLPDLKLLINQRHPAAAEIALVGAEPFAPNPRLF